jgi:hypothetical protein
VVLSITSASQEQSLKEQSDTIVSLEQAVEVEQPESINQMFFKSPT